MIERFGMAGQFSAKMRQTRFLVIDTSAYACAIVGDVLRGLGAGEVMMAQDAPVAQEIAERRPPDVVVMERATPEFCAVSFTRMVRLGVSPLDRTTPLILLASAWTPSLVRGARELGVDELLAKPFSARALERRLRATLLHRRAFVASPTFLGPCRRRRVSAAYHGPARRFLDEERLEASAKPSVARVRRETALRLSEARKLAELVGPGKRAEVLRLFRTAQSLEGLAGEVGDRLLAQTFGSLTTYLVGVGAGPAIEPVVVAKHLDVAAALLELGGEDADRRRAVSELLPSQNMFWRVGKERRSTSDASAETDLSYVPS